MVTKNCYIPADVEVLLGDGILSSGIWW